MTSREENRQLAETYAEAMGIRADDPQLHDYAACQDVSCIRCEAYGDGYSVGKETAYFEVRNWHPRAARALMRLQPVHRGEVGHREGQGCRLTLG